MNTASAHTRAHGKYSAFHTSLLHPDSKENYALRHIYSVENTKQILNNLGWTDKEIKVAADHITIDVHEKVVRLHIPAWIPVSDREAKGFSVLDRTGKIINGKLCKKVRGLSTFISKDVYVHVLIERTWAKADPYKLRPSDEWDEFSALGLTGDNYQLLLHAYHITCDCHAHSGVSKAFNQDPIALHWLKENEICQGQIPDKHVFSTWKYLNAWSLDSYTEAYRERHHRYLQNSGEYTPADDELEIATY
jgi:hypothetical protein